MTHPDTCAKTYTKSDKYRVQTFNDALESENRIHSDDIAKRFGFEGALVGGVVVFGHMCYQPVKLTGEEWLTDNTAEVKFLKPAYDAQYLNIACQKTNNGHNLECHNDDNALLSTMTSIKGAITPDPRWKTAPASTSIQRQEIHWDALEIDQAAPAHNWLPDYDTNLAYAEQICDDNPLYRQGSDSLVHPFWTSRECNAAFTRMFILRAWIHVGTRFVFHKPLRVGQQIEVRTIPIKKWERKGHEFATLYISFLANGEPAVEAEHTAIFKVAGD
ncbi:MAG: hypothetical protein OEZ23_08060 [Gammaproteobacteria bacterium]|nr:hypothetical protein [Gammaproteobacteria bacterium]